MELIAYFEDRSEKIFASQSFDEAKDHLAFYIGAYDLAKTFDLFSSDEDKKTVHDILFQLSEFVGDNF